MTMPRGATRCEASRNSRTCRYSAVFSYGGSRKMKSASRRRVAILSRPRRAEASISSAPARISRVWRFSRIRRAAADGFDAHGAGSGEEVDEEGVRNGRAEDVEEGFAQAIAGGAEALRA